MRDDCDSRFDVDFVLDDDPLRLDRDAIVGFLTSQAYWARWRSPDDINRQFDAAWRVVGAYRRGSGRLVGFARAVSDGMAIAYLADVFVDPEVRGRGLGGALVRAMIDDGPGAEFRWLLHTDDAHGLYRKFGFRTPDETYLERPAGPTRRRR
jgi:GNAT superfamily N-acetyltransferase